MNAEKQVIEISSYEKQAQDFLKATNTTLKTAYKEHAPFFAGEEDSRDIHTCTLRNSAGSYTFKFGQSIANQGKRITAYDVLACLTSYDPGTFEDFCSSFGYDEDSRKAEKTYKAVVKEYENISRIFTAEQIELLQEIN